MNEEINVTLNEFESIYFRPYKPIYSDVINFDRITKYL
jgi:hypothetical protein